MNSPAPLLTFAAEPWGQVRDEILAHGPAHYEEVSQFRHLGIPYDIHLEELAKLDAIGRLHATVARSLGSCVGYHVCVLQNLLHYRYLLAARGDVYFLLPQFRRGSAGLRLFAATRELLRARGVVLCYESTKLDGPNDHSRLFEAMGYECIEKVFSKWLVDPEQFRGKEPG